MTPARSRRCAWSTRSWGARTTCARGSPSASRRWPCTGTRMVGPARSIRTGRGWRRRIAASSRRTTASCSCSWRGPASARPGATGRRWSARSPCSTRPKRSTAWHHPRHSGSTAPATGVSSARPIGPDRPGPGPTRSRRRAPATTISWPSRTPGMGASTDTAGRSPS